MGTSRLFMPLLTELGGWEMDFAINMSRLTALRRLSPAFQQSQLLLKPLKKEVTVITA